MGKKKGKGKKGSTSTALTLEQFVGPRVVLDKKTAHLPNAPRPKTEEELARGPLGFRGGGSSGTRGGYNEQGAAADEGSSRADEATHWRRRGPAVGGGNDGGFGFGGREQGEMAAGPSEADTSNKWRGGRAQQQESNAFGNSGGGGGAFGGNAPGSIEAESSQQWRGGRANTGPVDNSPFGTGPRAVEPELPGGSWRRSQPAQLAQDSGPMFPSASAAETTSNWRGNAATAAQGGDVRGRIGGGGLSGGPIRGTANSAFKSSPEPQRAVEAQSWRSRRAPTASSGVSASIAPRATSSRFSSQADSAGSQSVRPRVQQKPPQQATAAVAQAVTSSSKPAPAASAAAPSSSDGLAATSGWTPKPKLNVKVKTQAAPANTAKPADVGLRSQVSGWTPKNAGAPRKSAAPKRSDENSPPVAAQNGTAAAAPTKRFGSGSASAAPAKRFGSAATAQNAGAAAAPAKRFGTKAAVSSSRFGSAKPVATTSAAQRPSASDPTPGSWAPRNSNVRKPTSTPSATGGAPTHQIVRPKIKAKPKPEPKRQTVGGGGGGLFGGGGARTDPSALKRQAAPASGSVRLRPGIGSRLGGLGASSTRPSLNPSRATQIKLNKRQRESAKALEEKKEARDKQSQFEEVLSKIETSEDLLEKEVFESGIKSLNFDEKPKMREPMIKLAVRLIHEGKINVKQIGKMFEEVFPTIAHELMLELLLEGKEKMGEKTLEGKVRVQQKKKFDLHAALKIEEGVDVEAWFDEKNLSCLKPKVDIASLLVQNSKKSSGELLALIKQHFTAVTPEEPVEEEEEAPAGSSSDSDEPVAVAVVAVAAPPPAVERSVAREASKIVFERYFADKSNAATILKESHDLLALVILNSTDNACEILLQAEKAWIGEVPDDKKAKPNLDRPALAALMEALYRAELATLNAMGAWRLVKPSKKKVYEGKAKVQALMATGSIIEKFEDEEEDERIRLEEEAAEAGLEEDDSIPGFARNQNYDD